MPIDQCTSFTYPGGTTNAASRSQRSKQVRVNPLKILVVDDVADTADSLAALLTLHRHDARATYDVERALLLAKDFEPDAVVLDINMPRVDGYAAAAALHRMFPWSPPRLIAFTARSAPADIAAAKQAGFDFHVSKSSDIEYLLQVLERQPSPGSDGDYS